MKEFGINWETLFATIKTEVNVYISDKSKDGNVIKLKAN